MQWGRQATCVLETARAARRSRSRGRYSWGEERIACAPRYLSLGGMSEAGPGQGAALSRACGRAAANAIKNPNWLFETQNHARTDDCVLETHQKALLDASHHLPRTAQAPVQPGTGCLFHCRRDRLRTAAVRGGLSLDRCDRLLTEKGAATALRRRQSVNRFTRERRSDRNAVVLTKPTPSAVLVALPRDP